MEGDEEYYENALLEVQQDRVDPGIWARAEAQARGNRHLTIALYVSFRVQQAEGAGKPQSLEELLGCSAHQDSENPSGHGLSTQGSPCSQKQDDLRLRFMARFVDQGLGWFLMLGLMFLADSAGLVLPCSSMFRDMMGHLAHHGPVWGIQLLPLLMVIGAPPLMLFMDSVLYAVFGNTPGKALFGVRVSYKGRRLSARGYALRNLGLWVLGMGMGIPVLSLIMVTWQYFRLRDGRSTLYDHIARFRVTCIPAGKEALQVSAV